MNYAITLAQIFSAAPHAHRDIAAAIATPWAAVSAKYGITSRNRALGFLSTAHEETGGFTVVSESLNYSAPRAVEVFPSIFPTIGAAAPYAYRPEAFANKVYDGRMGNVVGSDDGWRFRGQGLIQTTGRNAFAALAKATGLDLLDTPAMVTSDDHMLECAVACFTMFRGILEYCDRAAWVDVWALVGSGRANGPVINFAAHEAALAALERALPL
jgi:putative chitinase